MKRLRVRFDFDNTVVGLTQGLIDFHNPRCDCRVLTMADFVTYGATPCLRWAAIVNRFYECEGFYVALVQPYPYALDVIERIARVHDVSIVSRYMSRMRDTTARKRAVLHQHRSVLMPLLTGVYDRNNKDVLQRHGKVDVVVDDAPAKLSAERTFNPAATLIAIAQPYTRAMRVPVDVVIYDVATSGWRTVEAVVWAVANA